MAARRAGDRQRRHRPRRSLGLPVLLVAAFLWTGAAHAQSIELATAIKAAYLAKFEPFVDWPPTAFPTATSPIVICAFGNDVLWHLLDQAAKGQRIGERPVLVRQIGTMAQVPGCHILYIGGAESDVGQALAALHGAPILTVTDKAGGAKGVINFVVQDNRVRFEVDEAEAVQDGLKISSKLLSLATAVTPRR